MKKEVWKNARFMHGNIMSNKKEVVTFLWPILRIAVVSIRGAHEMNKYDYVSDY